jgi:hypothetical protein
MSTAPLAAAGAALLAHTLSDASVRFHHNAAVMWIWLTPEQVRQQEKARSAEHGCVRTLVQYDGRTTCVFNATGRVLFPELDACLVAFVRGPFGMSQVAVSLWPSDTCVDAPVQYTHGRVFRATIEPRTTVCVNVVHPTTRKVLFCLRTEHKVFAPVPAPVPAPALTPEPSSRVGFMWTWMAQEEARACSNPILPSTWFRGMSLREKDFPFNGHPGILAVSLDVGRHMGVLVLDYDCSRLAAANARVRYSMLKCSVAGCVPRKCATYLGEVTHDDPDQVVCLQSPSYSDAHMALRVFIETMD